MLICLCFVFLCVWLGMVLNQGQLSIVVSDWEPYLGSLFLPVFCGSLCSVFVSAQDRTVSFALFVGFVIQCSFLLLNHEHLPRCALVHFFKQLLHYDTCRSDLCCVQRAGTTRLHV